MKTNILCSGLPGKRGRQRSDRRAEYRDIEEVNSLLRQVLEVHAAARPDIFATGTKKYTDDQLSAIIADESTPVFVYMDENDRVKGYAFCIVREPGHENQLVPHRNVYIDDICVDEAYRRKGIATSLYRYVREYAKEIGCYHITLNVWTQNTAAQGFYESMGMHPLKTVMEDIL